MYIFFIIQGPLLLQRKKSEFCNTFLKKRSKANKECIYTYFIKAIKERERKRKLINCKTDESNTLTQHCHNGN